MMFYEIDKHRREYVYTKFINNHNLLLDWDRRTGKSNYSVTCILDYAINHPNTNNLVVGHSTSSSNNLLQKTIFCNDKILLKITKKSTQNRITLNNGSVIYYGTKAARGVTKFNTLLLDEITEFNSRSYVSNLILHDSNMKILMNCTNYYDNLFCHIRDVFTLNNISLCVDHSKSDEEVLIYLRNKKIQKVIENI